MRNLKELYKWRGKHYERLVNRQSRAINNISNLRLVVFVLGAGCTIFLYIINYIYLATAVMAAFLYFFIRLVIKHQRLMDQRKHASFMQDINEQSCKRVNGKWRAFTDTGDECIDENHSYSLDLDIFGKGSLFQWINTTKTLLGRQTLKSMLSTPLKNADEIKLRQEAVEELALKLVWRQRFTDQGMLDSKVMENPEELFSWAVEHVEFYTSASVGLFFRICPILTVLIMLFSVVFPVFPYYVPTTAIVVQLLLLKWGAKRRNQVLNTAAFYRNSLRVFEGMLASIESQTFNSSCINEIKKSLINAKGKKASIQINKLARIVDWISSRSNAYYFIFNIITLCDYQCCIALEKWKADSGGLIKEWLEAIGRMEALASISVIRHDNPCWTFPEVCKGSPFFESKGLGHPLIGSDVVDNDLCINVPAKILLITGSNMSGKSTLLRTAGINLVLAYAGAPVCAKRFRCSIMDVYTCMRVSDNLERNVSSFYAELLRIKRIVEAAGEGRNIFFLLDEIFKGTNSLDRHTGAKALVRKLSKANAIGLVSTHDLELGELGSESSKIRNYHFSEYYDNNNIRFDYKLKEGVSTTRNAIYLMKLAGIDTEDSRFN